MNLICLGDMSIDGMLNINLNKEMKAGKELHDKIQSVGRDRWIHAPVTETESKSMSETREYL